MANIVSFFAYSQSNKFVDSAKNEPGANAPGLMFYCGLYWIRTSGPYPVKVML